MNITVGTAVVQLPGYDHRVASVLTIENLGAGNLFFDTRNAAVTIVTGYKLIPGASYTFPKAPGVIYLIADAIGTDVRYLI